MALSEQNIIDAVYALYETDTTGWDTTSEEYLAARKYANIAIARWESYDNTEWRDLWVTLEDAADGDKTTDGTNQYDCPTKFVRPSSWVRIGTTFYKVVGPEKKGRLATARGNFCYFSGNIKDGFKLNFNANLSITTGDTIYYEFYETPTSFTGTTDTTEMSDPYYIVYFILARFLKNDGEDNIEELTEADLRLENMRVKNMSGYYDISDDIKEPYNRSHGFGK